MALNPLNNRLSIYSMRSNLNLALIILMFSWAVFVAPFARGQADEDSVPPEAAVDAAPVTAAPLVLELFSSQACLFCPKADALLAAEMKKPDIIAIACHVDYFDVKHGSLAQSFCTQRQSWYMQALGAGPNYTPQLIVNGVYDVIGHKQSEVELHINKASDNNKIIPLHISPKSEPQSYQVTWDSFKFSDPLVVWVILLDKPHNLKIAEGRNKGLDVSYVNIASHLEKITAFNPESGLLEIKPPLSMLHKGFAIIAQEEESGRIIAAGQLMVSSQ